MPTVIRHELIPLTIETLESLPIEQKHYNSLPHTALAPTGRLQQLGTLAVLLENELIRATVLPDLGGRILQLTDLATGADLLEAPAELWSSSGGSRHRWLDAGIQFMVGENPRPRSTGPMAWQSDGDLLWMGEVDGEISFHILLALKDDCARIDFELRILNRSLRPQHIPVQIVSPSILVAGQFQEIAAGVYAPHGVPSLPFWPRQAQTWTGSFLPISPEKRPTAATVEMAAWLGGDRLDLWAATNLDGKLYVSTVGAKQLELPLKLGAGRLESIELPEPIGAFAFRDSTKGEVLRSEAVPRHVELPPLDQWPEYESAVESVLTGRRGPDAALLSIDPRYRSPAYVLLGLWMLRKGEYPAAAQAFQDALLFNAEDPLAWWYKAVAERLSGNVDEDRQDLLNAHFLAPLEPSIRAESFLSMPHTHGREPTTLLQPLAERPQEFVAVAQLYLDAGLWSEAARFIDEALRHADLPALRYQLALCYLEGSRMHAEAAEQIRLASRLPVLPPVPPAQVLEVLLRAFPADPGLKVWHEIASAIPRSRGTAPTAESPA